MKKLWNEGGKLLWSLLQLGWVSFKHPFHCENCQRKFVLNLLVLCIVAQGFSAGWAIGTGLNDGAFAKDRAANIILSLANGVLTAALYTWMNRAWGEQQARQKMAGEQLSSVIKHLGAMVPKGMRRAESQGGDPIDRVIQESNLLYEKERAKKEKEKGE